MDKYFTPEIEDIGIGYICQINPSTLPTTTDSTKELLDGTWINWKFDGRILEGNKIETLIKTDSIRVPYLTKEQIEAEGAIHTGGKLQSQSEQIYEFKGYEVLYTELSKRLRIQHKNYIRDGSGNYDGYITYFYGYCRDINTFRNIFKLLIIN